MLRTATGDRLASKKAVKFLQQTVTSPSTEYANALWHNRLLAFRKGALDIEEYGVAPESRCLGSS
jgi:hypothetical protein